MMNRVNQNTSLVQKLWSRKGAVVLVLSALVLPACTNNLEQKAEVPETNVTAGEVADNTTQLIGKTVTVRSQPIKKLSESTFTISDKQFFGAESILVVNASGKPFVLPTDPNTPIQVTGPVSKFVIADIERQYKLNLDPNLYKDYESKPAIIAQSIALSPKPGEITTNPSQYYGKTLAVTGEVQDIRDASSFTLDEDKLLGGQDLLVISASNPQGTVNKGEKVAVTGVLRPFVVADLQREYNLKWDLTLQKKLEAEYTNKPVLVADGVYPSAIPQ
ncbi:MAG: hypothetical protein ACR2LR_25450 [Hassallia sp.]